MHIVIPLFDGFTALDVVGPYEVLRMLPDADVVFVGAEARPVHRRRGLQLIADGDLRRRPDADVLVVPGGPGTLAPRRRARCSTGSAPSTPPRTWTTSVCTGSLLLGAAGLLDGRRRPPTGRLTACGATAHPTAERVVREGKIVTAAGVSSGIDMALALAA